MAIKKTKILDLQSITGITSVVGIFTAGATTTDAGTAGTSYVKGLVAHNTGLGTCSFEVYIYKDTNPVTMGYGVTANRILKVDLAPSETTFFETNYPIVLTPTDAISVEVNQPDVGGTGIGSAVNFLINGDVEV